MQNAPNLASCYRSRAIWSQYLPGQVIICRKFQISNIKYIQPLISQIGIRKFYVIDCYPIWRTVRKWRFRRRLFLSVRQIHICPRHYLRNVVIMAVSSWTNRTHRAHVCVYQRMHECDACTYIHTRDMRIEVAMSGASTAEWYLIGGFASVHND